MDVKSSRAVGRARAAASAGSSDTKAKRSAPLTREKILKAATKEFSAEGLQGARVDRIALLSGANKNMIYHYFGSKDGLFQAVLERMYATIRAHQERLEIDDIEPEDGIRVLVEMTFEVFAKHPNFISLLASENLAKAQHIRKSDRILDMYHPLTAAIRRLLEKGVAQKKFRDSISAADLYISISALSNYHISNRHTLSALFGFDVNAPEHRVRRREEAVAMVLRYLRT
jgi:AcrR family transcriptional regulator